MTRISLETLAIAFIKTLPVFALFAVGFGAIGIQAADNTVNFQGKIINKTTGLNLVAASPGCVVAGVANDTCDFRVRVYNASTAGDWMFSQTFRDVEIEQFNGNFNLMVNGCNSTTVGTSQWGSTPATCAITGLTSESITTVQDDLADADTDPGVNFSRNDLWIEVSFAPAASPASVGSFSEIFSRKKLQTVPSAVTASFLNGISSGGFVQLQPTTAQAVISTGSSTIINIDETGSGAPDFVNFAVGGGSIFNVRNNGTVGIATSITNAQLNIGAATASKAQMRLVSSAGVNPTTPASGDLWWNGTQLYFRTASTTVNLLTGAGASDLSCTACVSNFELKTSTGAVSAAVGTGSTAAITMNDYSFFPNARVTAATTYASYLGLEGSGGFDTTGRFSVKEGTNCCSNNFTYWVGWRYVTASRDPEIFAWYDTDLDIIQSIWVSEIDKTDQLPIEHTPTPSSWIPIQAVVYDQSLAKLGKLPDVDYIKTHYKLINRVKNGPEASASAMIQDRKAQAEACLEANSQDETKCFKFINHPDVYYAELVTCTDCVQKHEQQRSDLGMFSISASANKQPTITKTIPLAVDKNGQITAATRQSQDSYLGVATVELANISPETLQFLTKAELELKDIDQEIKIGDRISLTDVPGKVGLQENGQISIGRALTANKGGKVLIATIIEQIKPEENFAITIPTPVAKQLAEEATFKQDKIFEGEVTFTSAIYLSDQSAGNIKFDFAESKLMVKFPKPYNSIPVISLSPVGKWHIDNKYRYSISEKTTEGFVVELSSPPEGDDVEFDWLAIGLK